MAVGNKNSFNWVPWLGFKNTPSKRFSQIKYNQIWLQISKTLLIKSEIEQEKFCYHEHQKLSDILVFVWSQYDGANIDQ